MMSEVLTYKGKPIDISFNMGLRFNLISNGISIGDFLITNGSLKEDFVRAWSFVLNEPYADFDDFLEGFNNIESVNPYMLEILKRDGVLNTERTEDSTEDKKKELPKMESIS